MLRALVLVVCLCALPSTAAAGECARGAQAGIVWAIEGVWSVGKTPVALWQAVADARRLTSRAARPSRIVVLKNGGELFNLTCPVGAACVPSCTAGSGRNRLMNPTRFAGASLRASQPSFRSGLSRASAWNDAVIGVDADGSADLADLFRGSRPQTIRFRWCAVDAALACTAPSEQIDWNGSTARVTNLPTRSGLMRIVDEQQTSESWVWLEPSERAAVVRAEYQDARDALETWQLPSMEPTLPTLDRLRRLVLASLGDRR